MNAKRPLCISFLIPVLGCSMEAAAQDRPPVDAPVVTVGDRWTWRYTKSNLDYCTDWLSNGAEEVKTVTSIYGTFDDSGTDYTAELKGPGQGWHYSRTYFSNGSYLGKVDGKEIHTTMIAFPLSPGKTWETTRGRGSVVTTLKCEAGPIEQIKIDSANLEVILVTCEGTWNNRKTGSFGPATYKNWYSAVVGESVRETVFTLWNMKVCADVERRLESYSKGK